MNILVTGGSGYIGKSLVEVISRDHNVYLTYKHKYPETNNSVKVIDISKDYNKLYDLEDSIDIIIHLATLFVVKHDKENIKEIVSSNIEFGSVLLEWAKERSISKFINISTYAQSIDGSVYNPQNFYSSTKEAFIKILEYFTRNSCIDTINLELYDTFGPNDNRPKFINLLLDSIVNHDKQFNMSKGMQEICYIYVDDVVNAIVHSIKNFEKLSKTNEIKKYSIAGNEIMSLLDMSNEIISMLDSDVILNPGYYPYRPNEIMKINVKYERLPGWSPVMSLIEGVKNIIKGDSRYENLRN